MLEAGEEIDYSTGAVRHTGEIIVNTSQPWSITGMVSDAAQAVYAACSSSGADHPTLGTHLVRSSLDPCASAWEHAILPPSCRAKLASTCSCAQQKRILD